MATPIVSKFYKPMQRPYGLEVQGVAPQNVQDNQLIAPYHNMNYQLGIEGLRPNPEVPQYNLGAEIPPPASSNTDGIPVEGTYQKYNHPDVMKYMTNKFPEQFLADRAKVSQYETTPEMEQSNADMKFRNTMGDIFTKTAQGVGNIGGKVQQTGFEDFGAQQTKDIDAEQARRQGLSDKYNTRAMQDYGLSKGVYDENKQYLIDDPNSPDNQMFREEMKNLKMPVPEGTTLKQYENYNKPIADQLKAKLDARKASQTDTQLAETQRANMQREKTDQYKAEHPASIAGGNTFEKSIQRSSANQAIAYTKVALSGDSILRAGQGLDKQAKISHYLTGLKTLNELVAAGKDALQQAEVTRLSTELNRYVLDSRTGLPKLTVSDKDIKDFEAKLQRFITANKDNAVAIEKMGKNYGSDSTVGEATTTPQGQPSTGRKVFDPATYGVK